MVMLRSQYEDPPRHSVPPQTPGMFRGWRAAGCFLFVNVLGATIFILGTIELARLIFG